MLVEQFDDPVHGQGSSHGDGRAFRFAYGDLNYAKLAKPGFWLAHRSAPVLPKGRVERVERYREAER
eukprot:scaffold8455_cov325-Pinguiococcus_pyrenoidosus.AAC.2